MIFISLSFSLPTHFSLLLVSQAVSSFFPVLLVKSSAARPRFNHHRNKHLLLSPHGTNSRVRRNHNNREKFLILYNGSTSFICDNFWNFQRSSRRKWNLWYIKLELCKFWRTKTRTETNWAELQMTGKTRKKNVHMNDWLEKQSDE